MNCKLAYGSVRENPRNVIHVVRVLDRLLEHEELDAIAERVRELLLSKYGEQNPAVVMVQGNTKETLRLFGEPYAVTRVRTAMFNAVLKWREFVLD
jgi:hypothetical protein